MLMPRDFLNMRILLLANRGRLFVLAKPGVLKLGTDSAILWRVSNLGAVSRTKALDFALPFRFNTHWRFPCFSRLRRRGKLPRYQSATG